MYVTRPLSLYRNSPEFLSSPPDGPNSGFLVIDDDKSPGACCLMPCKEHYISDFPFPQNKRLRMNQPVGDHTHIFSAILIPVINQPLSSNRYYAIKPTGTHKGKAYVSLKQEDKGVCWPCCKFIKNAKPKPLDPLDPHHQLEFTRGSHCIFANTFTAKSVAPLSYPPAYLRNLPWNLYTRDIKGLQLTEAAGVDNTIRSRLPELDFPVSHGSSEPEIAGKWYCPFMFIKDMRLHDQVDKSLFYEMTLERRWQRIFTCGNGGKSGNEVAVDVVVMTEGVTVGGKEAAEFEMEVVDGVVWFKGRLASGEEMEKVGMSAMIVERMVWEEESGGWRRNQKEVRLVRRERYGGEGKWVRFGCFVLVESFVIKRMDGSEVLTCDFKHTHQVKSKWE